MSNKTLVEYSVMFQNKDLKKFGAIWDVNSQLEEELAIQHVVILATKQAEEQDLEFVAMASAEKMVSYDEHQDEYRVTYLTPFKQIDINAIKFGGK